MIINVESNPDYLEVGEFVAFITGRKSVNTYPKILRVGKVLTPYGSPKGLTVEDSNTGKVWKPYSQDIIRVSKEHITYGVKATLEKTDRV